VRDEQRRGRIRDDVDGLLQVTEEAAAAAHTSRWRILLRIAFLLVSLVTLYLFAPRLFAVWSQLPQLRDIDWWWFGVMAALEAGSIACLWWLVRIALPEVPWFVAGTSQLSGNALSRLVPGGGPVGTALQFRMLSVSGVDTGSAITALGATGLVSAWVLFALPFVALLVSLLGSPVPSGMVHVAWGGSFVFLLMFGAGIAITRSDWLLETLGGLLERVNHWVMRRFFHREGGITVAGLEEQRDQMVQTLGSRFRSALTAAIGNWMLDYLVLVAALVAIGSRPRLSLVLLAYAVSAVLAAVPITPGGLGFVEAGLTATLTLAGIPAENALIATLAYRLFSYWLPLPAGLSAYVLFRRRYGRPPAEQAAEADIA
jgi:hypothetical protein